MAGVNGMTGHVVSYNDGTFMIQTRKESSFEINSMPGMALNSRGQELLQKSKDLYSVYNPNEISVKYNTNRSKA